MLKKSMLTTVATLGIAAFGIAAGAEVANADSVYTVQAGDTLSSISQKFAKDNSLVNKLAQDNNIQDINKIFVGQKLVIKDGNSQDTTNYAQTTANQVATNNAVANTATTSQATTNYASNGASYSNAGSYTSNATGSEAAAKAWIAQHESSNNYNARNGQYIGKYQLSASYLNGDYSPANQERVADQYVAQRYGSWTNAQRFWEANGWY